jgi:acyl carrier protein
MAFTETAFSTTSPVRTTTERIGALVTEILEKRAVRKTVLANDDLREVGLSSLDMVSLMLAVEAEFDLMIPESEMTPRNFQSISTIEKLLGALPHNA